MKNKTKTYILYAVGILALVLFIEMLMLAFGSNKESTQNIQGMAIASGSATNTVDSGSIFCRDSDGSNYFLKGTVRGLFKSYVDVCKSATILTERTCIKGGEKDVLINCSNGCYDGACNSCYAGLKCLNNYSRGYQTSGCSWTNTTNCSNGCSDGVCNVASNVACVDSDGGINFAAKGVVSGVLLGKQYAYSDFCLNDSNGNPGKVVGEYYCLNNTPKSTANFCTIGCNNGACIQNTTVNNTLNTTSCLAGTLDSTFKIGDVGYPYGMVEDIEVLSNGKILVGGYFNSFNGVNYSNFLRLNSDGSVDLTFNASQASTVGSTNAVSSIAMQSDGKIIIVSQNWDIKRLNSDGSLDKTFYFNKGIGYDGMAINAHVQSDGKVLIGGQFLRINDVYYRSLLRLNSNGSIDKSFNTGLGVTSDFPTLASIQDIKTQSDGKIIIAGDFDSFNGVLRNDVARLYSNGSLDLSFNPGVFLSKKQNYGHWVYQSDNKILLVGDFNVTINGSTVYGLVRINSDGTIDNTFQPKIATSFVRAAYIQSDGKIVVLGRFIINSKTLYVIRLNPNGSLDTTFDTSSTGTLFGTNDVGDMDLSGNKLVVGARYHVARLNLDCVAPIKSSTGGGTFR